ncbi:MAG: hypothetical protein RL385_2794 [Pseudomonadota bacterium]
MSFRFALRMVWRLSRRGGLRLFTFVACVAIGVASVVGVGCIADTLERSLRTESRALLGGDIAVESRAPLPALATWLPAGLAAHTRTAALTLFSSMVRNARGESRLAEIKAVSAPTGYPLAGELVVEPASPLAQLLDRESVLVGDELESALGLRIGDPLFVGERAFRVAGFVKGESTPVAFTMQLGPRVLMRADALDGTGLLTFGSRVRYRMLLAFPAAQSEADLAGTKAEIARRLPTENGQVSVESRSEAQPALRMPLRRVEHVMALVALLALLVASAGVALLTSAWLTETQPETAVLRCLGLRPREVVLIYAGHLLLVSALGSALGIAGGELLPQCLRLAEPGLLPVHTFELSLGPALRGLLLGVCLPLAFSLRALSQVWRVPPLLVLRSDVEALRAPRSLQAGFVLVVILAVLWAACVASEDIRAALGFVALGAAMSLVLWFGTRILARLLGALPHARMSPLLWHGLSAISRPGSLAAGTAVTLGVGTLVVLSVRLVEGLLLHTLSTALPEHAPSVFLVDVQPAQWDGVQDLAREHGATSIDSAPVIMGRLSAIDGVPVSALLKTREGETNERNRAQWVLTREQRITIARSLPTDNRIIAGKLLGSVLRLDVQGVPFDLTVTSLREVEWRSFHVNFFLVAEPGPLDDAPQFRIAAVNTAKERETELRNALAARYPNISVISVRGMLERAAQMFSQAAMGVRFIGAFAVGTGVMVLMGAVLSSQLKRRREIALLKTLGLRRVEILSMYAVEYALIGAVSGIVGAGFGYGLVLAFARLALELESQPSLAWTFGFAALSVLLSVGAGLLASLRSLAVMPAEILRGE